MVRGGKSIRAAPMVALGYRVTTQHASTRERPRYDPELVLRYYSMAVASSQRKRSHGKALGEL